MADVGRSTAAHASGNASTHGIIARLENWGAWQMALAGDGPKDIPPSPMFKDAVDRYRENKSMPAFDVIDAQRLEKMIAQRLGVRHQLCLQLRFIARMSSRRASNLLSRGGYTCSHTTYITWLDDAISNIQPEA